MGPRISHGEVTPPDKVGAIQWVITRTDGVEQRPGKMPSVWD